jgi:hypothetical protein
VLEKLFSFHGLKKMNEMTKVTHFSERWGSSSDPDSVAVLVNLVALACSPKADCEEQVEEWKEAYYEALEHFTIKDHRWIATTRIIRETLERARDRDWDWDKCGTLMGRILASHPTSNEAERALLSELIEEYSAHVPS